MLLLLQGESLALLGHVAKLEGLLAGASQGGRRYFWHRPRWRAQPQEVLADDVESCLRGGDDASAGKASTCSCLLTMKRPACRRPRMRLQARPAPAGPTCDAPRSTPHPLLHHGGLMVGGGVVVEWDGPAAQPGLSAARMP